MLTADRRIWRGRRRALLGGTALTAAAWLSLGQAAEAQLAASARPTGGQVVAGSARIGSTAGGTTIDQASNRAAIDWTSFDVGSGQSVMFVQPGAQSVTLNRVTGPDPSAIAGRISANGQIIITNPSGVVFAKGAQVNAQGLIVSSAGISNQNFMAGRNVFDVAGRANAQVSNQGTITVAQAGLAAMVAPAVANSGLISARLGHVVLAGAKTVTLDMYGDGLVAIDVTGQVTQVPVAGGQVATVLVSNTGTILADGGTVQLTAAAADGVIQNLVNAGGTVRADTVGGVAGQVAMTGAGGAVIVDGLVAADGLGAGQRGGQVQIAGSGSTTIAAGAAVSASGMAGGGVVAVGTNLARAVGSGGAPAGTSGVVSVAAGARIAADATGRGNGGRVTVLSTRSTRIAGALSARGGSAGGDGGTVEMSGVLGFALSGTADTSAPQGALGSIVLDPTDLTIVANGQVSNITPCNGCDPNIGYGDPPAEATVTEAQIEALSGNIRLQASNDLVVASNVLLGTQNLTLEAGNNLTVDAGVTVVSSGLITMSAAAGDIPGFNPAGALAVDGVVQSNGAGVRLNAGSGGISIGGLVAGGALQMMTTGALVESAGAVVGNVGAGSVSVTASAITLDGMLSGVGVSLSSAGNIAQNGGLISAGTLSGSAYSASLGQANAIGVLGDFSLVGGLYLRDAQSLLVQGAVTTSGALGSAYVFSSLNLTVAGSVSSFRVNLAAASATGGRARSTGSLSVSGTVTQQGVCTDCGVVLDAGSGGILVSGAVDAAAADLVVSTTGAFAEQGSGVVQAGNLTGSAGSVSLLAAGNRIAGIGDGVDQFSVNGFSVTAGNFALVDASGLSVGNVANTAGISVRNGDSIGLTLDSLYLAARSDGDVAPRLSALHGVVSIGPLTAGIPIAVSAISAAGAGTLSISGGGLAAIDAGTLQLGQLSGGVADAGAITLAADGNVLDLTAGGLAALVVQSAGAVSQLGALEVPSFAGQAASLKLNNGGNVIPVLAGFVTSAGDLMFVSSAAVSVQGAVDAGAGAVALSGVGLTLADGLTGGVVSLAGGGGSIVQTGGVISAAALSVSGQSAALAEANVVGTLNSVAVATGFSLTDAGALIEAGPVGASAATLESAGALTLAGDVTVAGALVLSAGGAIDQVGGALIAGTLSGGGAGVSLSGPTNSVGTLAGFVSSGNFDFSDTAALTIAGAVTAAQGGVLAIADDSLSFGAGGMLSAPAGTVTLQPFAAGVTVGGGAGQAGNELVLTGTLQIGAPGGGPVVFAGLLNFSGAAVLNLQSGGAVGESAGGGFSGGVLTGSAANLMLGAGGAAATTLSAVQGFTTAGGFTLVNAGSLSVGGLSAGLGVSVSSRGALMLTGDVAGSAVALTANNYGGFGIPPEYGAISQTGGAIVTGVLTGFAGTSANLPSVNNMIVALGSFAASQGFTLANAGALTVTGPLSGGVGVSLNTGGALTLIGTLSGQSLALMAGGGITQSGGYLSFGTLSGTAGGAVALGSANSIATLGSFSSSGGFTLVDGGALLVAGPVSDTGVAGTIALSAPSLTLTGDLSAVGVALNSLTGTIGQTGTIEQTGGVISAGTLSGAASFAYLNDANAVGVLGDFSASAGLVFNDATPLTIAGAVDAAGGAIRIAGAGSISVIGSVDGGAGWSVSLTAGSFGDGGDIGVAGLVSGGTVDVIAGGNLTVDSGGAIEASASGTPQMLNVNVMAGGNLTVYGAVQGTGVALAAGGNLTVGAGGVVGGSSFANLLAAETFIAGYDPAGVLGVLGTVALDGGCGGCSILLSSGAGGVSVGGTVGAGGAVLDVATAGAFDEAAGGVIEAGDLTGSAASVTLASPANQIAGIGDFAPSLYGGSTGFTAAAGNFVLVDSVGLTVGNSGNGAAIGVPVGGTISLATDSLALVPVAAPYNNPRLSAPAGAIVLQPFSAGATVELGAGTLGGAGTLSVTQADLAAMSAGTLEIGQLAEGVASAGAIAIGPDGSAVDLSGAGFGALVLNAAGAITQNGALSVAALGAQAASIALGNAANAIGTLTGAITTGGGLLVSDAGLLEVTGAVDAAGGSGAIALSAAAGIVLGAGLTGASVGLYALPGGAIDQVGGAITAGTLTGFAGAGASLDAGGNAIGTLAGFGSGAGFSLADAGALTVTGPLSDPVGVSLHIGGALTLAGVVTTPLLTLSSGGAVSQPGGYLRVGTLSAMGASLALNAVGNQVASVSGLTGTAGDVALYDADLLTIDGLVEAGGGAADVSLGSPIGVTLNAGVSGALVSLNGGAGQIVQLGGVITADTLSGPAATISLPGANLIGTLGGVTTNAGLMVDVAGALTVTGLSGGAGGVFVQAAGDVTVAGNVAGGAVHVGSGGNLTVAAGVTVAGSQGIYLGALAVAVGAPSGGGLQLLGTLEAAGPCGGCGVTLEAGSGGIAMGGAVQAAGTDVLLSTSGLVSEAAGGSIAAANLNATAAAISLTAADNRIGGLGAPVAGGAAGVLATAGDFVLRDAVPVTIEGAVAVAAGETLSIADDAISFAAGGTLIAPGGTVALSADTAGAGITLGDGGIGGLIAVSAMTLQIGAAGAGPISLVGAIDLTGVQVLDVQSAGAVVQAAGGVLQVGALEGSAASARLGGDNAIGTLGGFASAGTFSLNDAGALRQTGMLSAGSANLTVAGDLALDGAVAVAAGLTLSVSGTISQVGTIAAGTLAGAAAAASLAGANSVGTLDGFSVVGRLLLNDGMVLTVAGPVSVGALSLTGAGVDFAGDVVAASLDLGVVGAAVQTGGVLALGTLSGAAGNVQLGEGGGLTLARLGGLAAVGTVALSDAAALTIEGNLSAAQAVVSAVGAMNVEGGVFSLGAAAGSVLQVVADGGGAGVFSQTGVTMVQGLGGGAPVLTIAVPDEGAVTLADLQAPGAALVLSLGVGGTASGIVDVGELTVQGSFGAASLTGSVGGVSGGAAAAAAVITPAPEAAYVFDGCEIGLAACGAPVVAGGLAGQLAAVGPGIARPDIAASEAAGAGMLLGMDGAGASGLLTFEEPDPMLGGDIGRGRLQSPNLSGLKY